MSKYLIMNCDDFGQCSSVNNAIMHLLEERKVSSATIMPPAPAFAEAAEWVRKRPQYNIGLHLTLTSQFSGWRWKSLTNLPSLHDETGHMHRTVEDFEHYALAKDVRAEIRAQFQAVKKAGLNIVHVDNHMGSLYGIATGRNQLAYVLMLCSMRGMPFRLFRRTIDKDKVEDSIPDSDKPLTQVVALADVLGVGIPDYMLSHPYHMKEGETYDKFKKSMIENIYVLPEGVSETYIHPATDDFRLGKLIPSWRKRVWEYKLMLDPDFDYALRDAKVKLTDYRFVRDYSKRPRVRSVGKFVKLMLTKRQASNDW